MWQRYRAVTGPLQGMGREPDLTANVFSKTTQKKLLEMAWTGVRNCCSCTLVLSCLVFLGLLLSGAAARMEAKQRTATRVAAKQ